MQQVRICISRCTLVLLIVGVLDLALLSPASAQSLPVVPGHDVQVYAELINPMKICFGPDGMMYLGNGQNDSSGDSVYRVGVGGGPGSVSAYGDPVWDPDPIGYDSTGLISGTPGAVLTGGGLGPVHFTAILPGGKAKELWDGPFSNPTDIAFDSTGRMLLLDATSAVVYQSRGERPTALFDCPEQDSHIIAVDHDDNIYISLGSGGTGRVLAYSKDGAFLKIVASGFTTNIHHPIAFGKGGAWGRSLYVVADHVLMRFDSPLESPGVFTTIGTGFSHWYGDMEFGPDGALYISEYTANRILRIGPLNSPPTANGGADRTIECACQQGGTLVTLNGTGSSDPDGNPLTYTWTGPFAGSPATGPSPTVKLMPGCRGSYEITLVVNDGQQDSAPDTVQITVQDTTAPSLTCPEDVTVVAQSPSGVPASDPMIVAFLAAASATDNCDPSPVISHDAPEQFPLGSTTVTFTATDASSNTATCQAKVMVIVEEFYLHGVDPALTLDGASPTGSTPKYKDSPSLRRTDFREIGTWTYAVPSGILLHIGSVRDLHVWVGLKNSDDQGTYFDIRAELLKNGTAVASGEVTNIQGVTRNPDKAKEVVLDFGVIPAAKFNAGDILSLRILTKVTDVGGHNSAVGLRLYYDSVSRSSRFKASSSQ